MLNVYANTLKTATQHISAQGLRPSLPSLRMTATPMPHGRASLWGRLRGLSVGTDVIKWVASVAQILGYGATAMGVTPLNMYFFVFGILGWFIVGLRWNDRAIILIHIVAAAAMLIGMMAT